MYWSYALTGSGLAHLQRGEASEAIAPLERALALRTAAKVSANLRAETAYALARALWLSERDRPRAEQLAEDARALLPDDKDAELRDIDTTLASWRLTAARRPPGPRRR